MSSSSRRKNKGGAWKSLLSWSGSDTRPYPRTPLISVVLPTRDRRDRLERAIASVTRQTYPNWQLVVVDDGSVDATPEFLAGLDDKRIRSVRARGLGACAARNIALGLAAGEIIAYLDDDNTFHEEWLKSVAWGFAAEPRGLGFLRRLHRRQSVTQQKEGLAAQTVFSRL